MSTKRLKLVLCITTNLTLAMMVPALPAMAQSTAPTASASDMLPEVVVTASRRAENLRDVPIAVTALSAETLEQAGITNTTDIGRVTPGVVLPLFGAYVLPSIRGISSNGSGLGDSSNVAVYVDGVYQASQSSQMADLPDVQSIQVLKGPQGSLYGQNAAGGAIIVDTISPSFELRGKVKLGYGNFQDKIANGYVTGPIVEDKLAFLLSGSYRDRRGLSRDLLRGGYDDGLRSDQIRGKLLWTPTESVSLTLAAYRTNRGDTGIYSGAPLNGNSLGNSIARLPCNFGGLACLNLPLASKPHEFSMNILPDSRISTTGVSVLGNFKIGELGELNTVSSYHTARIFNSSDVDNSPVNGLVFQLGLDEKDYIQEFNFVSNKFGNLSFTTGLFYLYKEESYSPTVFTNIYPSNAAGLYNTAYPATPQPVFVSGQNPRYIKESYAAYLEANYDFSEKWTLTVAGRYSNEKAQAYNSAIPFNYREGNPLAGPRIDPRGDFTFEKFTPRVVLRYKPDEYNMVYASYSQGFKSGYVYDTTINTCVPRPGQPATSCINPPVRPETVESFEVGYKGRLFDHLDLKIAAFHSLYKDIQVFVYNAPNSTFENAAEGKINGVEVEATYRPTSELTFNGGFAYLKTKYSSFPRATVFTPTGFGNALSRADVSGNQLMRTPEWTANAAVNYTRAFANGEFGAYLGGYYSSDVYYDAANRVRQKAYATADAELSFAPEAISGMRLVLWGKNLTNVDYLQSVLVNQLADSASYADPRTYGVRVEYTF